MNTPYICFRCRYHVRHRNYRLRKASFVSLGKLVDNDNKALKPRELKQKPNHGASVAPPPYRSPQRPRDPQDSGMDSILETLFSSNQRQVPVPTVSRYSQTRVNKPAVTVTAPETADAILDDLRNQFYTAKAPLEEVWAACLQLFAQSPRSRLSVQNPDHTRKRMNDHVFRDILLAISGIKSRDPARSSLPAPAEIIKLYKTQNIMQYWWDQVLWRQLGGFLELTSYLSVAREGSEFDGTIQAQELLEEIFEVWKLFTAQYGIPTHTEISHSTLVQPHSISMSASSLPQNRNGDWRGLSEATQSRSAGDDLPAGAPDRFLFLLPRHPNNRRIIHMSAAALMTVDCLHWLVKVSQLHKNKPVHAEPFVNFVTQLVRESKIQRRVATQCLLNEGVSHEVANRILTGWGPVPVLNATKVAAIAQEPSKPSSEKASSTKIGPEKNKIKSASEKMSFDQDSTWQKSEINSLSIDLHKAVDQSHAGRAASLWQDFQKKLNVHSMQDQVLRDELYAQFLTAFFALRRSEQAVDVWNYMVRSSSMPTQKHWHAMIVGCTKAKDLISLQEIWSNMVAAGIEPDIQSWTSRMYGLIMCRKWQLGLQALEELGMIWKAKKPQKAHKGEQTSLQEGSEHDLTLPSIIPIRAVLRSLVAIGKTEIAHNILAWAKLQDLKLDTQTFNILLRPAVRAENPAEVQHILQEMENHNCQPDVATFTIIINGLISNHTSSFHTQSPEVQQAAISKILQDMEDSGLQANAYTYSTILDGILAENNPLSTNTARVVLDHMAAKSVKPSPHIYTILMTHYFSTNPPDLPAIDALWRRIKLQRSLVDPIFYDRMIESYARVGEVERMLYFLRRMPMEGKSPGWMALGAVLKALMRVEEWGMVRDLLRDVQDKDGLFRHGPGVKKGKSEFWELVEEVSEHMSGLDGDV